MNTTTHKDPRDQIGEMYKRFDRAAKWEWNAEIEREFRAWAEDRDGLFPQVREAATRALYESKDDFLLFLRDRPPPVFAMERIRAEVALYHTAHPEMNLAACFKTVDQQTRDAYVEMGEFGVIEASKWFLYCLCVEKLAHLTVLQLCAISEHKQRKWDDPDIVKEIVRQDGKGDTLAFARDRIRTQASRKGVDMAAYRESISLHQLRELLQACYPDDGKQSGNGTGATLSKRGQTVEDKLKAQMRRLLPKDLRT